MNCTPQGRFSMLPPLIDPHKLTNTELLVDVKLTGQTTCNYLAIRSSHVVPYVMIKCNSLVVFLAILHKINMMQ